MDVGLTQQYFSGSTRIRACALLARSGKSLVRSARRRPFRAALMVAAAITAGAPIAAWCATIETHGDSIVFVGRIDASSASEFLEAVRRPGITRLVITSRGGLVSPALDMAAAVHERGLDVDVPTFCYSSCANYVFPAGRRKVLGRRGAIAWHGNMAHVLYEAAQGHSRWSAQDMASARALAKREAAFFRQIGIDGYVCWFAKIPPYNVDDFYYLSPSDMARFGIGDVTVTGASEEGDTDDERPIAVDWTQLNARRPDVSLEEQP
jgi:hypothetical protein